MIISRGLETSSKRSVLRSILENARQQQEEREGPSRSRKQQGCPERSALQPGRMGGGDQGEGGVRRGELQRNQHGGPSVPSQGVELYPTGSEQGWRGLPFKYLQGHSSASVSLSCQIQGNFFSFPGMVPKAEAANLNCH